MAVRIDAAATLTHYVDHLAPVWKALDPEERGTFHAGRRVRYVAERYGIVADPTPPASVGGPVLVAAARDLPDGRDVVMLAHGAGQTYAGDLDRPQAATNASYTGGTGRERVVLNLVAGPYDLAAVRSAQPGVPAVAVGVPKLDRVYRTVAARRRVGRAPAGPDPARAARLPVVALAWHWDASDLIAEARWAYPHYAHVLSGLAADGRWTVLGHGHPRVIRHLSHYYRRAGIDTVRDLEQVWAQADLLVADNSSVMYEAAALGIPVLTLNAPWYRRHIHHGLRFWSHVPGMQCDEPDRLADAVAQALSDPPAARRLRQAAVAEVYGGLVDGAATVRAVAAIREHVLCR